VENLNNQTALLFKQAVFLLKQKRSRFATWLRWRKLIDDFRTMDWIKIRKNLRFTTSRLKYLRDMAGE